MAVQDRRVRPKLAEAVESLRETPELKGKALLGELSGYRSLRAAGQRFRVVYRIERPVVTVVVIAVGRRRAGESRDLYELARKLIRLGLAEPAARYRAVPSKKKDRRPARRGR